MRPRRHRLHRKIGAKRSALRQWMRELSEAEVLRPRRHDVCRNPRCDEELPGPIPYHGFCERCWRSQVRVLDSVH